MKKRAIGGPNPRPPVAGTCWASVVPTEQAVRDAQRQAGRLLPSGGGANSPNDAPWALLVPTEQIRIPLGSLGHFPNPYRRPAVGQQREYQAQPGGTHFGPHP
ncbi:MAG: hypothetical protein ANABAC_3317 [Anaerolineae bacterium]|nr:MAG: hypothetical protein ANABAC_3317 [Anaerolineae bacterium]